MNITDWKLDHHTSMYDCGVTVVRRGLPFCLNFNNFKPIAILLQPEGRQVKTINLKKEKAEVDGWKYICDFDPINITLFSSCSAAVGLYHIYASNGKEMTFLEDFFLLFNPWLIDDDVYMNDETLLSEYILGKDTNIYAGSYNYITARRWKLDQFEQNSVKAAIDLLSRIPYESRNSPVEVTRALSALINSNDDNGVLTGNWSGDYEGGTSPLVWNRSLDILTEFVRFKRPVKFGQCWVFSGILCTVLRTIGIPARCITSFGCFHDSDGSLNWEVYVDENLNVIKENGDSCWNYHCWNEAWMKRNDLGLKYDGWQVLDATPQERSEGLFRLGPASKYAIKNAKVKGDFDVGFAFAEVNANKIYYKKQSDGSFKQYMVKTDEVGKNISTKKVGCMEREDITLEYKREDDSALNKVINDELQKARSAEASRNRNISISFCVPSVICMTDLFDGSATISAMCDRQETTITSQVSLISYTGKLICELIHDTVTCLEKDKTISFFVDQQKLSKVVNSESPYISCKVSVYDPKLDEYFTKDKVVSIITPDIEILGIQKTYSISTPIILKVYIRNKLERSLTNLYLSVEFTDYNPPLIVIGKLRPGEVSAHNIILTANTIGQKTVKVEEVSQQCAGFVNTATFYVSD